MKRNEVRETKEKYFNFLEEENKKNEAKKLLKESVEQSFNSVLIDRRKSLKDKYKGKFFNKENRPEKGDFVEINSGVQMVEIDGYKPVAQQIMEFTMSGKRLEILRSDEVNYNLEDDMIQPLSIYPEVLDLHQKVIDIQGKKLMYDRKLKEAEDYLKEKDKEDVDRKNKVEQVDNKAKAEKVINDDNKVKVGSKIE